MSTLEASILQSVLDDDNGRASELLDEMHPNELATFHTQVLRLESLISARKRRDRLFFKNHQGQEMVICRAYGKTLNGNPMGGRWGLFNIETGEMPDFDQYLNDLIERWDFERWVQ